MTALHLARTCGRLNDVDEMLDGMTPQEFEEVIAYDSLFPLSNEPDRKLAVLLVMLLVNQWREKEQITEDQIRICVGLPKEDRDADPSKEGGGVSPDQQAMLIRMLVPG